MIKNTGIQRETDRKTETEIEKGRGDRHTERGKRGAQFPESPVPRSVCRAACNPARNADSRLPSPLT